MQFCPSRLDGFTLNLYTDLHTDTNFKGEKYTVNTGLINQKSFENLFFTSYNMLIPKSLCKHTISWNNL